MARGVNLINTEIKNFSMSVQANDAMCHVEYIIYDDAGNPVKTEVVSKIFSLWSNQIKANLNNALRLISQEINNNSVAENTPTWTDL